MSIAETASNPFAYMDVNYTLNEDYLRQLKPQTQEYIRHLLPQKRLLTADPSKVHSELAAEFNKLHKQISHRLVLNNEAPTGEYKNLLQNVLADYQVKAHYGNLEVVVSSKEHRNAVNPFIVGSPDNPAFNTLLSEPHFDPESNAYKLTVRGGNLHFSEDDALDFSKMRSNIENDPETYAFRNDAEVWNKIADEVSEDIEHRLRHGGKIDLLVPLEAKTLSKCVEYTIARKTLDEYKKQSVEFAKNIFSNQDKYGSITEEKSETSEVLPLIGVQSAFNNLWNNPLTDRETQALNEIIPESFLLAPGTQTQAASKVLLRLNNAAQFMFEDYLKAEEPKLGKEEISEKLTILSDFECNGFIRYKDLVLQKDFSENQTSPIQSFKQNKKSDSFKAVIDPNAIDSFDKEELENKSFIEGQIKSVFIADKLLKEEDFASENFRKFWTDHVTEPLDNLWQKFHGDKPFDIEVKRGERTLQQVVVNRVFEPAKEVLTELKKSPEFEKSSETEFTQDLDAQNQKAYETLVKAYAGKQEFKDHPRLLQALKAKLHPLFKQAQEAGLTVSLNRYAIDAPSRNATQVQIKQPAREKEK